MRICGIGIEGTMVITAILDFQATGYQCIESKPRRLQLLNPYSSVDVKLFRSAVGTFFRDHKIDISVIRKRIGRGDYASSGMSFKIEGLIQLTDCCSIDFLAPQTITAFLRKHPVDIPNCFYAYQKDAFETAYVHLMQKQI